jgi:hypothetical protein
LRGARGGRLGHQNDESIELCRSSSKTLHNTTLFILF